MKSFSCTALSYDYIPDYEETYKGVHFSVGLDIGGTMGLTIEFPTEKELCKLLNVRSKYEITAYSERTFPKSIGLVSDYFMPYDFDVFIDDKRKGNQALLVLRRPFMREGTPQCKQLITLERLDKAKSKYRKTYKKYPDVNEAYMINKKDIEKSILHEKLKGLSDDDIVDFVNDFNLNALAGKNLSLFYLTIENLSDVCRRFIDAYVDEMEVKSNE